MASAEESRPRMTISRALEMALLNRQARQPSVKILVSEGRVAGAEVFAAHDDIEEAERQARVTAERIMGEYPPPEQKQLERGKVSLTRNAKGETQIDFEGRWSVDQDLDEHAARFEALRGRFPLADGTATHDAPRAK